MTSIEIQDVCHQMTWHITELVEKLEKRKVRQLALDEAKLLTEQAEMLASLFDSVFLNWNQINIKLHLEKLKKEVINNIINIPHDGSQFFYLKQLDKLFSDIDLVYRLVTRECDSIVKQKSWESYMLNRFETIIENINIPIYSINRLWPITLAHERLNELGSSGRLYIIILQVWRIIAQSTQALYAFRVSTTLALHDSLLVQQQSMQFPAIMSILSENWFADMSRPRVSGRRKSGDFTDSSVNTENFVFGINRSQMQHRLMGAMLEQFDKFDNLDLRTGAKLNINDLGIGSNLQPVSPVDVVEPKQVWDVTSSTHLPETTSVYQELAVTKHQENSPTSGDCQVSSSTNEEQQYGEFGTYKPTMRQVALLYSYQGKKISSNNSQEIAQKYGSTSGHYLQLKYDKVKDTQNRIGYQNESEIIIKYLIKDIRAVIPFLTTRLAQLAEKEIITFEQKIL